MYTHAAMRYVRIIGRTEVDTVRGRGPSLQVARQGISRACGDFDVSGGQGRLEDANVRVAMMDARGVGHRADIDYIA
jgi:hypothetical protein